MSAKKPRRVSVKTYTRKFSKSKLPPRATNGRFKKRTTGKKKKSSGGGRRRGGQGSLF